jgi:hypothetical protein
MRFVMAGNAYELTSNQVRSRLVGQPEDIREHWVEIDGVRWPVKQVLETVTGVHRREFTSQTARRQLARLGFVVSDERGATSPSASVGSVQTRSRVRPSTLPEVGAVTVTVAFVWRHAGPIDLGGDALPAFPPLPSVPGLYRFTLLGAGNPPTVYIGESVNLARRGRNYRNAKTDRSRQRTSRRIHQELVRHLGHGGSVHMDIAVEARLGVDGKTTDLRRKSARRLAENAAVLLAQMDRGVNVLNIDADLGDPESEDRVQTIET